MQFKLLLSTYQLKEPKQRQYERTRAVLRAEIGDTFETYAAQGALWNIETTLTHIDIQAPPTNAPT